MKLKYCPCCARPLTRRLLGGRERLACPEPACGWVFWDNPAPVVAALVEREGQVILVNNQQWPPNWWGLVTGFLEHGEEPEEAVVREVAEELGLEAELVGLIGVYGFPQQNQVIMAYHLRLPAGEITLNQELTGYKAIPVERLKPWDSATGRAVADWLARRREGRAPGRG